MSPSGIERLLFDWDPAGEDGVPPGVAAEDDTRDALQCVAVRQPIAEERIQLLELSSEIGVQVNMLGFPAASSREKDLCVVLARHVGEADLPVLPVVMARAERGDVAAVAAVQEAAGVALMMDLYVATSALRMSVEGWSKDGVLSRLRDAARFARAEGLEIRIAFEDSSRTSPGQLREAIDVALECGAGSIVLNDTVGAALPAGARRQVEFARAAIDAAGCEDVQIGWHGHNDKGLGLANALAAAQAGATLISATFLGVGERAGNVPLEQLLVLLADCAGGRYRLDLLPDACCLVAELLGVALPDSAPAVGRDAFTTGTGTHAAAILKARAMGPDFEDAVYAGVSALALGRSQRIVVGPHSGRAAAVAALEAAAIAVDEERVARLLEHCRRSGECLRDAAQLRRAVGD